MARFLIPAILLCCLLALLSPALGVAAPSSTRPQALGVVFRLTPDYGVASIYLKDGGHVPAAQIYGSLEYQDLMRRGAAQGMPSTGHHGSLCQLLGLTLNKLSTLVPSAFGPCRSADVITLKALLSGLNAAVESYVGTDICFTCLVLDDNDGYIAQLAREALDSLGIRQLSDTLVASDCMTHAYFPPAQLKCNIFSTRLCIPLSRSSPSCVQFPDLSGSCTTPYSIHPAFTLAHGPISQACYDAPPTGHAAALYSSQIKKAMHYLHMMNLKLRQIDEQVTADMINYLLMVYSELRKIKKQVTEDANFYLDMACPALRKFKEQVTEKVPRGISVFKLNFRRDSAQTPSVLELNGTEET